MNKNHIEKWANDMKETIHKKKEHMKRCSNPLKIKEMQIETTLIYFSSTRLANLKA